MAPGYDREIGILVAMQGQRVTKSGITSRYENDLILQRGPENKQNSSHETTCANMDAYLETDLLDQSHTKRPPPTRAEQ